MRIPLPESLYGTPAIRWDYLSALREGRAVDEAVLASSRSR